MEKPIIAVVGRLSTDEFDKSPVPSLAVAVL